MNSEFVQRVLPDVPPAPEPPDAPPEPEPPDEPEPPEPPALGCEPDMVDAIRHSTSRRKPKCGT